jgi:hypothetical protein
LEIWLTLNFTDSVDSITHLTLTPEFNFFLSLPVTFGHAKSQVYTDIYNTRISYPTATILLGQEDVKACFRYPRIHTDSTGAFGFIADELYNLATAMAFGSTASASSWEAFRQAIKALTKVLLTGQIWSQNTRHSLIC